MKFHKRKSWLFAIAFAFILLAMLAFIFSNHHDKALTASVESPHKSVFEPEDSGAEPVLINSHRHNHALTTDNPEAWDDNSLPEGEIVRLLVTAANNATSATDYLHKLEELSAFRPRLAAYLARMLEEDFCEEKRINVLPRFGAPASLVSGRLAWCANLDQTLLNRLKSLEDDFPESDDWIERMAADPIRGPYMEMEHLLESIPEEKTTEMVHKLAHELEIPEHLLELVTWNNLNSEIGSKKLDLGLDLWSQKYRLADLTRAQNVASQLFMCERTGGCAPGQYTRTVLCTNMWYGAYCPDGTSIQDVLYMTTPPIDWELAQEILWRLRHRKP